MVRTTLREYNREIENLIESGQNEEAIAPSRHILQDFPQHLATHRLLGKAYLELHRYEEAAGVFQHVLDCIPDDFISHLGMSVIREHEADLDTSIWHMERAFDVQPANAIIQGELRRLYKERDGLEPQKIHLTRGALARMYAKGDLYSQAIAELRAALAEEPQRPDLQVVLAKMYAKSGQLLEAAETSSSLLTKLPNCLEAHYILGDILSRTERAAEAQSHYQRAAALDPYAAHISQGQPNPELVPDDAVMLEQLEYSPGEPVASPLAEQEWADAPASGLAWDDQQPEQAQEDFMEEATLEPDEPPAGPQPAEETPQEEIPDWMQSAGWEPASGVGDEAALELHGEEDEYAEDEEELVQAEIPDWLKPLAPSEADEPISLEAQEGARPWSTEDKPGDPEKPASWPQASETQAESAPQASLPVDQAAEGQEPAAEEGQPEPEEEIPAWLEAAEERQPEPGEETLTWMEAEEEESPVQEVFESEEARIFPLETEMEPESAEAGPGKQSGLPEWLPAAGEEAEVSAEQADSGATEYAGTGEEAELPEWLREMSAEAPGQDVPQPETEAGPPGEAEAEAEIPDWLRSLKEELPEEQALETGEPAGEPAGGVEELAGEAEIPEWLKSLGEESLEEKSTLPAGEFEKPFLPEAEEPAGVEEPSGSEVPDWLRAALEEQEQSQAEQPTDIPDWLRSSIPEGFPEEPPPIAGDTKPLHIQPVEELPEAEPWSEAFEEEAPTEVPEAEEAEELPEPVEPYVEAPAEAGAFEAQEEDFLPGEEGAPPTEGEEEAAAMAWLESLAARQGALEEELLTRPEERPESIPEWLQKMATDAVAETEEAGEGGIAGEEIGMDQPGWLQEAEAEVEISSVPAESAEPDAELPDWLRDFVEEEPGPSVEEGIPSVEPPAPPAEPLDLNTATLAQLERIPGVGFVLAQNILNYREAHGPLTSIEDLEDVPGMSPDVIERLKDWGIFESAAAAAPQVEAPQEVLPEVEPGSQPPVLAQAWAKLVEGEVSTAMDQYNDLIRKEQHLDQVIHDLREAAFLYPQEISLHQALGDAYLRANRLQEALDAYNKAEDLLK